MYQFKALIYLSMLLAGGFLVWRKLIIPQARAQLGYRFAIVIAPLAVAVCFSNLWLYYGTIFAAMVALPRTRNQAAGLFIGSAFLLSLVNYEVFVGSVHILPLYGYMVAALGLLPAFRFPALGKNRAPNLGAFSAIMCLLLIVQIVIDTRVADTNFTTLLRNLVSNAVALGIPYFFFNRAASDHTDGQSPLFYLITVGFMLSAIASFEMLRHWPLYQTVETHLGTSTGLSKTLILRGGLLRAPGPFSESTAFGVFLAITTMCTAAMRSAFRSQMTHAIAFGVGCFGCFASLSRNAWIGLVIGLIISALYRGRFAKAAITCAVLISAMAVLVFASPNSGLAASLLGKGDTLAASTTTYRQDLVIKSIPLIKSSPLIGTAVDDVRARMRSEMRSGSLSVDWVNSYLFFLVITGIAGLFVFVLFMLYPAVQLFRKRKTLLRSSVDLETATALFSAHVSLAAMLFGTSFYERIPLLAVLLFSMTRLVLAQAQHGPARQERATHAKAVERLVIDPRQPTIMPIAPSLPYPGSWRQNVVGTGTGQRLIINPSIEDQTA